MIKRIYGMFFIFLFIYSLPLFADAERKKEIDDLNREKFLRYSGWIERTRSERKWNGIDIPKSIWKMIDKYRYVIIQGTDKYCGPLLPRPYSPAVIAEELKRLVEYNDTFYCSHCDTDIPIYVKCGNINKRSIKALDGLPMDRVINPPKECPICGVFGEELVPFTVHWFNDFYNDEKIDLYENHDVWDRYKAICMQNRSHYELMSFYQRAAWANKNVDNELFKVYIENALFELTQMIANEEVLDYSEEVYGYLFHKAELLRQLGYFEESKKYIDLLVKREMIEKHVSDFFYDLLEKKFTDLAPMPNWDGLRKAIADAEKDEVTNEIRELAKDKKLLNDFGFYFYNPLSYAIYLHKTNIAKFLIDQGADPYIDKLLAHNPLPQIVASNNKKLAELLINKDNINKKYLYGYTLLCYAIETANLDMVKFLVERGADPTFWKEGKRPIIELAFKYFYNHLEEDYNKVVEYLLTLPQINQSKKILKMTLGTDEEANKADGPKVVIDISEYESEDGKEWQYGTTEMLEMVKTALQKLEDKEKNSKETQK